MAVYELGVRTPAAAAGAAYADLRTGANERLLLLEVGFFTTAATSTSVGIVRPLTIGTASTTQAPVNTDSAGPASNSLVGTVWSAAPTIAGTPAYSRRLTTSANIGAGFVLQWSRANATIIPVSSSLLFWNFGGAAGAACDAYFVVEEVR